MKNVINFFKYMSDNSSQILTLLIQHIEITIISVIFAIIIGVPLGIFINRYMRADKYVLGFMNIIQAIPSLAMLGFFIPLLGIGVLPAVVVVILYSLLPIVKNTYTGLQNINPKTLEAAKGIGLTRTQILVKVEFPLALPVIMSGIRISVVTAVGLVTIAALIGAGGLGYLVYSGIQTVNMFQILAGAIPAAILALCMDFIFGIIENVVTPIPLRKKSRRSHKVKSVKKNGNKNKIIAGALAVAVIVVLIVNFGTKNNSNGKEITIGSKNYTEQIILGNMYSMLVEDKTDIKVNEKFNLGGTQVIFSGMQNGDVDAYVEYTGTALIDVLKQPMTTDSKKAYDVVKKQYAEKYNIDWLDPIGFNNTYALAVKKEYANTLGLKKISDLVKYNGQVRAAPTMEFSNRPDGLPGVENVYGIKFKSVNSMDAGLRYTALAQGNADLIDAFSTDGLLKKYNLTLLKDDKSFFPPYYAAPIIREDTLKKYPELKSVLNLLAGKISDEQMMNLNYQVDVEHKDYKAVAKQFLIDQKLISK